MTFVARQPMAREDAYLAIAIARNVFRDMKDKPWKIFSERCRQARKIKFWYVKADTQALLEKTLTSFGIPFEHGSGGVVIYVPLDVTYSQSPRS